MAAAVNLGNKDKGNISGSQSEEEKVSSTTGEDEERVKSIDDLVPSSEGSVCLFALVNAFPPFYNILNHVPDSRNTHSLFASL